jgi:N-acetyl-gamma-glutamyl-phosphate reductase/acetylglutamate kinase
MSSRDIRALYQERYAGEKLVKVTGEPPSVKAISGKHGVVRPSATPMNSGNMLMKHSTGNGWVRGTFWWQAGGRLRDDRQSLEGCSNTMSSYVSFSPSPRVRVSLIANTISENMNLALGYAEYEGIPLE